MDWTTNNYQCNECERPIPVHAMHWHCSLCHDHDQCEKCFKQNGHPHPCYQELGGPQEKWISIIQHSRVGPTVTDMCKLYQNRPSLGCLGGWKNQIDLEEADDVKTLSIEQWDFLTFESLGRLAKNLASGILHLLGDNPSKQTMILLCGKMTLDRWICDLALLSHGLISCPIPVTMDDIGIQSVLKTTASPMVICTPDLTEKFRKFGSASGFLKWVIELKLPESNPLYKMDLSTFKVPKEPETHKVSILETFSSFFKDSPTKILSEIVKKTPEHGIPSLSFSLVSAIGKRNPMAPLLHEPSDIATLIYTSGSTGIPKGAILKDSTLCKTLGRRFADHDPRVDICFSFSDRLDCWTGLMRGARVACTSGNTENLYHEVRLASPTEISATPRFYNALFTQYCHTLANRIEQTKDHPPDIDKLTNNNNSNNQNNNSNNSNNNNSNNQNNNNQINFSKLSIEQIEKETLKEYSMTLGTRLKTITTGGAPTSPVVMNWLNKCFSRCRVRESYGTTECGGITGDNNYVLHGVIWKIRDWQEFTAIDKPYPRGELLVKTRENIGGYFANEGATSENFDSNGFFQTGDIVEVLDDNRIRVIGRKKNFWKLSQGEFVSPETIESAIESSKLVEQVLVVGESIHDYVVGIIVPTTYAWELHVTPSQIEKALMLEMRSIAPAYQLRTWEIPRGYLIDKTDWCEDNQLMTSSGKKNRFKIQNYYKQQLAALHQSIQKHQTKSSASVSMLLNNVLDIDLESNEHQNETFLSLGGDSLSAAKVIQSVKNEHNLDLPVDVLYNTPLSELTSLISKQVIGSVPAQKKLPEGFWLQETLLDESIQPSWNPEDQTPTMLKDLMDQTQYGVFMTGVSGFVGSFLLRKLVNLRASSKGNFPIFCLVRAPNSLDPKRRLIDNLKKNKLLTDDDTEEFFSCVHVLKGDLSLPKFGLDTTTWDDLASRTKMVFHAGTWVNTVANYQTLKPTNTTGTETVIRLCFAHCPKTLIHISTLSVLSCSVGTKNITEHSPLEISNTAFEHLGGYGGSKLVAEHFIQQAEKRGLNRSIFRLGFMGPAYNGACNLTDADTRLILGCSQMGFVPDYNIHGSLEQTSIDFVADSILTLSNHPRILGTTYHVFDRDSSLSLNSLTDEMIDFFGKEKLQRTSFSEWQKHLKSIPSTNPLFPLRDWLLTLRKFPGRESSVYIDQTQFTQLISDQIIDPPQPIDQTVFRNVLAHLKELNLF